MTIRNMIEKLQLLEREYGGDTQLIHYQQEFEEFEKVEYTPTPMFFKDKQAVSYTKENPVNAICIN